MKHYTIVYEDLGGTVLTHTTTAHNEGDASLSAAKAAGTDLGDILHVIEHHIPRVTVVLEGDMVRAAYADGAVELLHVYGTATARDSALENEDYHHLMPTSRQNENLASKLETTVPFDKVEVGYDPEEVEFDHTFVNDLERVAEYGESVRQEVEG